MVLNKLSAAAVLVLLLGCAGRAIGAQTNPSTKGEALLEEGRTLLDVDTLKKARAEFQGCAAPDSKGWRCYYLMARADLYLDKAEAAAGHKEQASQWLDAGISDVGSAIAANGKSSDAHALLADLYGAKISGMMSGMRYGPKATTEVQKALQLDSQNAQVYAVMGRKYLYSPSAFGGDVKKAVESFAKASQLDPHCDECFVWLALAYRKEGDSQAAQKAIAEALRLNSRSVFARRVEAGRA